MYHIVKNYAAGIPVSLSGMPMPNQNFFATPLYHNRLGVVLGYLTMW